MDLSCQPQFQPLESKILISNLRELRIAGGFRTRDIIPQSHYTRADSHSVAPIAPPILLALHGFAGIGKSVLSEALAQKLNCAVMCKDDFKDKLVVLQTDCPDKGITLDTDATSYSVLRNMTAICEYFPLLLS